MNIKIKMLRLVNGLTQAAVAERLNCSELAYSKIEEGATDITDSRLRQLAKVYNMSVADIYNYWAPQNNSSLQKLVELREDQLEASELILQLRLLVEMFERKFGLK